MERCLSKGPWYASLARQCPYSYTAAIAGQPRKYVFLPFFCPDLYISPWTSGNCNHGDGAVSISRVDTKVGNKALLAPCGCRAFEQVSAVLLYSWLPRVKRCGDVADTKLAKSDVIQTGHIWFFELAVCFWVLGLPLFCDSTPRYPNFASP